MFFATFVDKYQPAVIIKFNAKCGETDDLQFQEYLNKFQTLYEQNETFNVLLDGRDVESFPITYAMKHAGFLLKNKELTKKYIKKSAIILNNQTLKNILDIVFSIYTPESDMIITENFREGLIHVLDQQESKG